MSTTYVLPKDPRGEPRDSGPFPKFWVEKKKKNARIFFVFHHLPLCCFCVAAGQLQLSAQVQHSTTRCTSQHSEALELDCLRSTYSRRADAIDASRGTSTELGLDVLCSCTRYTFGPSNHIVPVCSPESACFDLRFSRSKLLRYHRTGCQLVPTQHRSTPRSSHSQQHPASLSSLPVSLGQDATDHTTTSTRNMSLLDVQSEQLAIKLQKEANAGQGIFDIAGMEESQADDRVPSSSDFSALGEAPNTAQPSAAVQVCEQPRKRLNAPPHVL